MFLNGFVGPHGLEGKKEKTDASAARICFVMMMMLMAWRRGFVSCVARLVRQDA
jgi:nitroreductase